MFSTILALGLRSCLKFKADLFGTFGIERNLSKTNCPYSFFFLNRWYRLKPSLDEWVTMVYFKLSGNLVIFLVEWLVQVSLPPLSACKCAKGRINIFNSWRTYHDTWSISLLEWMKLLCYHRMPLGSTDIFSECRHHNEQTSGCCCCFPFGDFTFALCMLLNLNTFFLCHEFGMFNWVWFSIMCSEHKHALIESGDPCMSVFPISIPYHLLCPRDLISLHFSAICCICLFFWKTDPWRLGSALWHPNSGRE